MAERSEPRNKDDPRLQERPTGRQPEPADERSPDELPPDDTDREEYEPGEAEPDDLWKSTRTHPVGEREHHKGETKDGLDRTEEEVRREAEQTPSGGDDDDLPYSR